MLGGDGSTCAGATLRKVKFARLPPCCITPARSASVVRCAVNLAGPSVRLASTAPASNDRFVPFTTTFASGAPLMPSPCRMIDPVQTPPGSCARSTTIGNDRPGISIGPSHRPSGDCTALAATTGSSMRRAPIVFRITGLPDWLVPRLVATPKCAEINWYAPPSPWQPLQIVRERRPGTTWRRRGAVWRDEIRRGATMRALRFRRWQRPQRPTVVRPPTALDIGTDASVRGMPTSRTQRIAAQCTHPLFRNRAFPLFSGLPARRRRAGRQQAPIRATHHAIHKPDIPSQESS